MSSTGIHSKRRIGYCVTLVLWLYAFANSLTVTQPATGISVTVETTGAYSVAATPPAWTFGGNLAKTLTNVVQVDATDKIGAYTGISFNLTGTGALQGTIRLYANIPVAMFSMKCLAPMATQGVNFPDFTAYPKTGMYYMGQKRTTFAPPTFTLTNIGGGDAASLVSYNTAGQTFVFSPADHFWEVNTTFSVTTLRVGIKSWATPLPSGWDHVSILAVSTGINKTCDIWGQGLRGYYGKPLPTNQSITLNTLGYWTDNFAGYYYYVDPKYANYQAEMMAVKAYFETTLKLKLGYLMLDSWWYKKGCSQLYTAVSDGIYEYKAAPAVFPKGLGAFHDGIGLPFVTHHRWYEASCSPIAAKYGLSKGLPLKYTAWNEIISGVADSGSLVFEQDWLDNNALVAQHIGDLDSAMGNMARVCMEKKIEIQYCMQLPMYFMQAAKYPCHTTIRSTNDGYRQSYWNDHIFNSRFCWSVGDFPWVDCFKSSEKGSVVSCVLAAAFFPPSDRIGAEVIGNILPATRKDGILVHPDQPALPTEKTYIDFGAATPANPVTRTWTDHGNNLKTYYVWVPGANATSYSFNPAAEGMNTANGVYAYKWFAKTGKFVSSGASLTDACASGTDMFDYWVVAPVGPSQIAFLGDLSKYVSCGRSRVTSLTSEPSQVTATIDLEPQEANVTISGFATVKPNVICSNNAAVSAVAFANNIFSAVLTPNAGARTPMTIVFGANPTGIINRPAANPMAASLISITGAQGKLTVDIGHPAGFSVQVFTPDGKRLLAGSCKDRRVWSSAAGSLTAGTYLVRVSAPSFLYVNKCFVR